MWQVLILSSILPLIFLPSFYIDLDPSPLCVCFLLHSWAPHMTPGFAPLCVFSTLQILLSHHFSLSWPFLVQGKVVASFLLQVQVPDLCLILSPFSSSNAPGWGVSQLSWSLFAKGPVWGWAMC